MKLFLLINSVNEHVVMFLACFTSPCEVEADRAAKKRDGSKACLVAKKKNDCAFH